MEPDSAYEGVADVGAHAQQRRAAGSNPDVAISILSGAPSLPKLQDQLQQLHLSPVGNAAAANGIHKAEHVEPPQQRLRNLLSAFPLSLVPWGLQTHHSPQQNPEREHNQPIELQMQRSLGPSEDLVVTAAAVEDTVGGLEHAPVVRFTLPSPEEVADIMSSVS